MPDRTTTASAGPAPGTRVASATDIAPVTGSARGAGPAPGPGRVLGTSISTGSGAADGAESGMGLGSGAASVGVATAPAPGPAHTPAPPRPPHPSGALALLRGLLRTSRPRQWVKNLLVVAAPVAAGQLWSWHSAGRLALVFGLFTAAAAAVYLVNDARDAAADRAHPVKRHRPVAAGVVPVPLAYGTGAVLGLGAAGAAALWCNGMTVLVLAAYLSMQLAYCVRLKHVLVVDLAVVAAGFLLRAMTGGIALNIPLSRWFLITTGFGALFMVAAKRYSEAVQLADAQGATRALLTQYTPGYLRFVWQSAAVVAVLGYCLWALESGGVAHGALLPWRQLSVVAFVLAVLRYAVFADRGTAGAPEDVVLKDRPLAVIGLVWAAMYGMAVADL